MSTTIRLEVKTFKPAKTDRYNNIEEDSHMSEETFKVEGTDTLVAIYKIEKILEMLKEVFTKEIKS